MRPRRPRIFHLDYLITLSCGCIIKTQNPPHNRRVTYGCTTGLRHGYTLPWTSFTHIPTGYVKTPENP